MQYGFVIDHSRCIGCHACTVACKVENDVPLGVFRTWVKYVEEGSFPQVRRSFAVLRCNQCTAAPCVTICPTAALEKRPDGIVDVDPLRCIGCKACMQGCPYDALYLNEEEGTAQKCHFCIHRVERGIAPACAVVCPTQAIIPGDFADPSSAVARMRAEGDLVARKVEARTGPNVWYREVAPAAIEPALTNGSGGHLWSEQPETAHLAAERWEALEARARGAPQGARTVYDVPRRPLWGWKVSAYLFTKSIAAGAFLALAPLVPPLAAAGPTGRGLPLVALLAGTLALALTTVLLVADLARPARFLFVLRHAQRRSWLARGAFVLAAYGALLSLGLLLALGDAFPGGALGGFLVGGTAALAGLAAAYTAWLMGQAKGRVLWMRRLLAPHLLLHAVAAGAALLLVAVPFVQTPARVEGVLRGMLAGALGLHLLLTLLEGRLAPRGREAEYARAHRLVERGPYAPRHWGIGVGVGVLVPALLLAVPGGAAGALAGALVLVGLWSEEDVLVRAGQALPIS